MKKLIPFILLLSSCASSSGALRMGPDMYSIRTDVSRVRGGINGSKQMAYDEGTSRCAVEGKEFLMVHEQYWTYPNGAGDTELVFRCLDKNDRELSQKRTYSKDPNIIVQVR